MCFHCICGTAGVRQIGVAAKASFQAQLLRDGTKSVFSYNAQCMREREGRENILKSNTSVK